MKDPEFTRQAIQLLLDARAEKCDHVWWSSEKTGMYSTGASASVEITRLAVQALLKWRQAPETTSKALRESAELAKRLMEQSCAKQNIQRGQLRLHADRGTSMSSKPVAFLLADLGVTKTHSRPHVWNDNAYSESQFRTLKYRPEFPDRFGCIRDSRAFSQGFFCWYDEEHRHSGLGLLTPAMVHYNQTALILEQRQTVLDAAYRVHPERFVRQAPKPTAVPSEVRINKPLNTNENTH